MREERRRLPGLDERHRCPGHFAQYRLRQLISQIGVQRSVDMAVKLGLRSYALPGTARDYDPESNESLADFVKRQNIGSFTLGPIEVNALELSNVAATLASGGTWCPPNPIGQVLDRHGNEVSVTTETCEQAVPEGLANTLANAMSKDDQAGGTASRSAGSVGWDLPMSGKTGTTEAHRSSGFLGFTNQYAAANYIYDDSTTPGELCSFRCASAGTATCSAATGRPAPGSPRSKPIANNFGPVALPPTDPRYVDGGPGSVVPTVNGLDETAARQRLKESGFQVADGAASVNSSSRYGTVVGTSPAGQTIPGSIITIQISNGIPPAPAAAPGGVPVPGGPPPEIGQTVVEIPGLPPITVPVLGPPPPRDGRIAVGLPACQ